MAQTLFCCVLVGACIVAVSAVALPVIPRAGAIYLGYNATFCRNLNFTTFVPRGNCSAFYQCQNNNLWLNYCQYPLQYNHLNGYCDHPWNVRCNRTGFARSAKAADVPTSPRAGATYLGYNATFCRNQTFTTYVPRGNCSAYYLCRNNSVWLDYCQYPMQYNHLNGFCDHPWNVRCNRTFSRAAEVSDKTHPNPNLPTNQCSNLVNCFVDPCSTSRCPGVPLARCHADYCGGCKARWFNMVQYGTPEVTHRCHLSPFGDAIKPVATEKILYPPINQCEHPLQCFVRPCQFAQCSNVAGAQCFDDFCSCRPRFFKIRPWSETASPYIEVTQQCKA